MNAVVWPPVVTGGAAVLAAYLDQLEHSQWLEPKDLAAHQRDQLALLLHHAAEHSPFFKARLARTALAPADIAAPDGLQRLPVTGRRDIQKAGASLFATALPEGHAPASETRTSGSTGEPVVIRRTAMTQLDWLAMTLREHLWQGSDFSGRLAAIRANIPAFAEHETWGPPASLLFGTGRSLGVPITTGIAEQFERLGAFAPTISWSIPATSMR